MPPLVVSVEAQTPFKVRLRFTDGREGVVDLADVFALGGVFAPLRDPEAFARVRVEHEFGTIEWPSEGPGGRPGDRQRGVDLDPYVLYSRLTGTPLEEVLTLP